jgi:hypothetical protein
MTKVFVLRVIGTNDEHPLNTFCEIHASRESAVHSLIAESTQWLDGEDVPADEAQLLARMAEGGYDGSIEEFSILDFTRVKA